MVLVLVLGVVMMGEDCGAGWTSGVGDALGDGFEGAAGSCGLGDKILLNTRD
jgi:hypothetical protein